MPEVIRLDDPAVTVLLRRSARARRFTLTVRPGEDAARLTAPAAAPAREARLFLERQAEWLRGAMARAPSIEPVAVGSTLPVEGRPVTIRPAARGPCRIDGDALLAPPTRVGPAVAAFLKTRARDALAPAAHAAAATLGAPIRSITLRDTRSRWGSCTARGDLSFSWRLAMAPPEVLRYVAVHEAAHLLEMNHGPAFWALVSRLRPGFAAERAWLRREGAALHRYRF
ncbi:MAG: M48 family peptidase [Rhodobacteraceae bacterium]|nr:MAG: M48 family peptidase [Paracoccaceae bacterium]